MSYQSLAKPKRFQKVLVANRGEIAIRICRTLNRLGITSVVIHSEADRYHQHVSVADVAVRIDGNPLDAYLNIQAIIWAARDQGVDAIMPGYGFLAENAEFARACEENGIVFVGPTLEQIERFGLKHMARELAEELGVPLNKGSGLLADIDSACSAALSIGYPVMLKSAGGGGGIGMARCDNEQELRSSFQSVTRLAESCFSNPQVFLEKFIEHARHVEVQIFGDGNGNVVAMGERDCSIQRRNQKIVEETPAPNFPEHVRQVIFKAAETLARAVRYRSAGTVEFLYDEKREEFYFIEVNARLQVEHCVTEQVLGIDLVEWMIGTAAGYPPDLVNWKFEPKGSAIEVRICAEEPLRNFMPSSGTLTEVHFPPANNHLRVDGWIETGTEVLHHFDSLLAKMIVHGRNRGDAMDRMHDALMETRIAGVSTNLDFLLAIVDDERYRMGKLSTQFLADFDFHPSVVEVREAGTFTTIQDYPGRVDYWPIGCPPSGPMDAWAFRMANRILGNSSSAAGLECTIAGPAFQFHVDAQVVLTGAPTDATLDSKRVQFWRIISVKAGQILRIGRVQANGCRMYLGVQGGFKATEYLGSKSTFTAGNFGGLAGRAVRVGDMLPFNKASGVEEGGSIPMELVPSYGSEWRIGCMVGPHGAPDFFTDKSFESFFKHFTVHYNFNRLGIRLFNGPRPEWSRPSGGEAGLHPSNIHDCPYAIGSVNFTGDTPIILTCDGPSLGGFVCPITVVTAEMWKVGQLKAGDRLWFQTMNFEDALALELAQDKALEDMAMTDGREIFCSPNGGHGDGKIVLFHQEECATMPEITYRQAGDKNLLVEYGSGKELDLGLRCRVHAMMDEIEKCGISGVLEVTPGVRSLQVHYDSRLIHQQVLLGCLVELEQRLRDESTKVKVNSRVVYLPMCFEDPVTLDAIARYRRSIKDTAPWLPSNVDFIRRINGLEREGDVREIVFAASYMVLGLGVYMCIYGMDSPGGYQLVGRTLPIWNTYATNKHPSFKEGKPWLLRLFDRIHFYPVRDWELEVLREDFRHGRLEIRIEDGTFDFHTYNRFLQENEESIGEFKVKQREAFDEEVAS